MLAFHGKPEIKEMYLARVRAHALAEEVAHGFYWENGKGCAVGCTIHSGTHKNYETELGIPIMLARLEDRLFEGMSNGKSKEFPERFLSAIPVGADLLLVGWKFLHWLLTEELTGRDHPKVKDVIKRCANVLVPLTKGLAVDREEAIAARREAYFAATSSAATSTSAYAASYAASYAAAYAAATSSAASSSAASSASSASYASYASYAAVDAADAASYAVADAADAAADASYAAVDAADGVGDASYAVAVAAKSESFSRMADKLIELMSQA